LDVNTERRNDRWGLEAVALLKAEVRRLVADGVAEEVKKRLGRNQLPPAELAGRRGGGFRRPGQGDVSGLYPTMKRGEERAYG